MKPTELLKALFFSSVEVIWTIIKTNWGPIYTTVIKMAIIAALIWGACALLPHGILFLKEISYLGWLTILFVWRLINVHYDDFDQTDELDEDPLLIPDEEQPEVPLTKPLENVRKHNDTADDSGSTRE